jgi:hypothetical protein
MGSAVVKYYAELMAQHTLRQEPLLSAECLIAIMTSLWNKSKEELILNVIMSREMHTMVKTLRDLTHAFKSLLTN